MNIAVCEDDRGIQELVKIIIEDMSYNVFICSDSIGLDDLLKNHKINLIVIDYWLGKVTADDIVTKMKKNSDLPIILMSAIHNLKEVATKLKVDDYIEKPFHIDVFKTKINNLIHDFHNNNN